MQVDMPTKFITSPTTFGRLHSFGFCWRSSCKIQKKPQFEQMFSVADLMVRNSPSGQASACRLQILCKHVSVGISHTISCSELQLHRRSTIHSVQSDILLIQCRKSNFNNRWCRNYVVVKWL